MSTPSLAELLVPAILTLCIVAVVVVGAVYLSSRNRSRALERLIQEDLASLRRRLVALPRVKPRGTTVDVPVLYINLKRSPERRERMEEHLASQE